jgi:5-oxoprolinase (ATP-hydrolysing) subunit A
LITQAQKLGLKTASEVFADRTYTADGRLTPRSQTNALIADTDDATKQVVQMISTGTVTAATSETVPIMAETVCIHGDGPHAVEFAKALRTRLDQDGIEVRPFSK